MYKGITMNIIMGITGKELIGMAMLTFSKMTLPLISTSIIGGMMFMVIGSLMIECKMVNITKLKIGIVVDI